MRFALAFVAILVVSLATNGEGSVIPLGSTGAVKSVKELADLYESSRIVNPNPDDDDDEVVTESGKKMSVKDLVASYEKFLKSDTLKESGQSDQLPTVEGVKTVVDTGKKFNPECLLCKLGAGSLSGKKKPKKEWWEFLCF